MRSSQTIPVVVLTTSQAEQDVLRAYALHANCYITKPVDFKQFHRGGRSHRRFLAIGGQTARGEMRQPLNRETPKPAQPTVKARREPRPAGRR